MAATGNSIGDLALKDAIWACLTKEEDNRLKVLGHGTADLGRTMGNSKMMFTTIFGKILTVFGGHPSVTVGRVFGMVLQLCAEKNLDVEQRGLGDFEIRGADS